MYPGLTEKIIDLSEFIDSEILKEKAEDIIRAKKNNKYAYGKAFNYLKAAGVVQDGIIESNRILMDHRKVNRETRSLLERVFAKEVVDIRDNGFKERHLFSAAITPEGYVDYIDSILEHISEVYYIGGSMGTGKSDILKRIVEEAKIMDYHIEIYHDPLRPEKFESVFIKELDTIVTSNKNGNKFAQIKINLDDYLKDESQNQEDYEIYKLLIEKGIESLNGAKKNHFILEESYKPAIDYEKITEIREKLYKEILSYK